MPTQPDTAKHPHEHQRHDFIAPASNDHPHFLTRGVVAIAWAVVFAVAADASTTDVAVGAGVLLVI